MTATVALSRTVGIPLRYANRHGLITGATGSGKSVTLMHLAEGFQAADVPVFVADVKGDIAALARSSKVAFLDPFGAARLPLQTLGADLLSRALELSDVQSGVLEVGFAAYPDCIGSLADLRHVLARMQDNREALSRQYGLVTPASIAAVQRALLRLESEGVAQAFGSTSFDIAELLQPRVSILTAERLYRSPRLYAAFVFAWLWQLESRLPEVGDVDRPRLVFIFDEAHLLFDECPAPLLRRIERTIRLIRSKGVGVWFASQRPDDVPPIIREQLAHRIEHGRGLAIGQAKVATLDAKGNPLPPSTVKIDLPACELGALTEGERATFAPPERPKVKRSHVLEIALIMLGLALACGLTIGAWWTWQSDYLPATIAIAAGGLLALGTARVR